MILKASVIARFNTSVIASAARQSRALQVQLDCRAALAMTEGQALAMTEGQALAMTEGQALAMTEGCARNDSNLGSQWL